MIKAYIFTFTFIFLGFTQDVNSQTPIDLIVEPGFEINIFASDLDSPRQMIESLEGTIFLG